MPASAAANGSSLIAVDPQAGALTKSVSADGRFAYVGSGTSNLVRRFNLPDLTPDISVALGSGPNGELAVRDIQVSPFEATMLSVERQRALGDGNRFDIALIDDGVVRPDTAPGTTGQQFYDLQWTDATHLYATTDNNRAIATVAITAGEISSHSITPLTGTSQPPDGRSHWDGFFLYRDNGEKVDVLGGRVEGMYAPSAPGEWVRAVVPDANLNRLFALVSSGSEFRIQSYTLDTRQPIASVPLAQVPFEPNSAPQLIRFGANGLAASTNDGRLLLVEGAFVAP